LVLKTLGAGQGHEGSSLVDRKDRHYFAFLSKRDKVNSLKTILYSKELHIARRQVLVSTLLVPSYPKQNQGLPRHPTPVSGRCRLLGSFVCAKEHKVEMGNSSHIPSEVDQLQGSYRILKFYKNEQQLQKLNEKYYNITSEYQVVSQF